MVFTKLARIICGRFHKDNYLDAINYLAIAYECEARSLSPRSGEIILLSKEQMENLQKGISPSIYICL